MLELLQAAAWNSGLGAGVQLCCPRAACINTPHSDAHLGKARTASKLVAKSSASSLPIRNWLYVDFSWQCCCSGQVAQDRTAIGGQCLKSNQGRGGQARRKSTVLGCHSHTHTHTRTHTHTHSSDMPKASHRAGICHGSQRALSRFRTSKTELKPLATHRFESCWAGQQRAYQVPPALRQVGLGAP